jgi:ribosomal protein L37AE/L43A
MTIETVNTAATERPRHFARCAQCDSSLVVPEWSERVSERCVRYLWSCDACGYGFETSVYFPKDNIV